MFNRSPRLLVSLSAFRRFCTMTYTLEPPLPPTSTPKDYHRLLFDPSAVPAKRIVGLLACQRDPLLRRMTTRVVAVRPAALAAPPAQRGKANKKKPVEKVEEPSNEGTVGGLWEVETEDTVIFPEGGGQPSDTGSLLVASPNGPHEQRLVVEHCLRRKLDSVHLVRVPPELEEDVQGLEGKDVAVEVDWDRRLDHMSIHTGQHLLSAILDTLSLPTLSWSMTAYPSLEPPYVELPRGLTWAEAESVEARCNALINEGKKVWVDVDVQEEGKHARITMAGEDEARGIPKDYTGGVIRVINIDSTDKNACCGTQLPSLALCQSLHVIPPATPSTATKPSSNQPTRLYFTAGPRAVGYLAKISREFSLAAQAIAVGRGDLVERVSSMNEARKETLSREKDLRGELGKVLGDQASLQGKVTWVTRDEKSTHDFEFLGFISSSYFNKVPEGVIVITSSPPGVTPVLLLVQSKDEAAAKAVYEGIKSGLEEAKEEGLKGPRVKGGGAKGRFMGKVEGKWGKADDEVVKRVLDGRK
ncbi:hypothetical protein BCR39DRAFT_552207, partial [Naematelia encephala]